MSGLSSGRSRRARLTGRPLAFAGALLALTVVLSCAGPRSYEKRTAGGDSALSSSSAWPGRADSERVSGPAGDAPERSSHAAEAAPGGESLAPTEEPGASQGTDGTRAVAVGLLLDSAPSAEAINEGLVIAEALMRCYGLGSGDSIRSRGEAARRARREILDRLELTEDEIRTKAASLGYSLEPGACGNTCENVRSLALLELEKQALRALAGAAPGSCAQGGDQLLSSLFPSRPPPAPKQITD